MSEGRIDSVALFQGCGYVKRIANGRNNKRFGTIGSHCLVPKRQQTGYSRILQYEQPTFTKFFSEQPSSALAKLVGDGRIVPTQAERPPIIPSKSSGHQDFVVEFGNRHRFPIPLFVIRTRHHQVIRQIAPH